MPDTDSKLIKLARLAEDCERYEDMAKLMKEHVELDQALSDEERNLFSVAYKNVVGLRRTSWRIVTTMQQKEADEIKAAFAKGYQKEIEEELLELCRDVISLLDKYLLKTADQSTKPAEAKVFFYKMKGDYLRYQTEVVEGDKRGELITQSQGAYDSAVEAAGELSKTHPIRLGLALNVSVFYYEIKGNSKKACEMAKQAFDDAIAELDNISDDSSYKDSTLIMQLLRDNLTLWTSETDEEEADQ